MNKYELGLPIMEWSGNEAELVGLGVFAEDGSSVAHVDGVRGAPPPDDATGTTWLRATLLAEDENQVGWAIAKMVAVLQSSGIQVGDFAKLYSETWIEPRTVPVQDAPPA